MPHIISITTMAGLRYDASSQVEKPLKSMLQGGRCDSGVCSCVAWPTSHLFVRPSWACPTSVGDGSCSDGKASAVLVRVVFIADVPADDAEAPDSA